MLPVACVRGPITPLAPTPTPTPNTTPVCGFTPVPYPTPLSPGIVPPGNSVIQNAAQWTAVNSSTVPLPAVNFNLQMILEVSLTEEWSCSCDSYPPTITSVCFYSDHIEVDYANPSLFCPTPIPGTVYVTCNSAWLRPVQVLAAVPQSNLPVVWVGH